MIAEPTFLSHWHTTKGLFLMKSLRIVNSIFVIFEKELENLILSINLKNSNSSAQIFY